MAEKSHSDRFDRIFEDEAIRKTLYENGITPKNYLSYEEQLRSLFRDDEEYIHFVENYFTIQR